MPRLHITPTIADEWMGRCPDDIPARLWIAGMHEVSAIELEAIRADAEFNSDSQCGPEFMSRGTRAAYRALLRQCS